MADLLALTDDTFDAEVLEAPIPVLVDFWAPWCGPCRQLGPIVEAVAAETAGKLKVAMLNTDENPSIPQRYGITSIPTLNLFVNSKVVASINGAQPKHLLLAALAPHLE